MEEPQDYNPADEPVAFDMGFSTLHRINYWLWRANEANAKEDVDGWFKALKIIFKEVDPFIKKSDDRTKFGDDKIKEIEKNYNKFLNYNREFSVYSKSERYAVYNPPREIFDSLYAWERDLRRMLDEAKLLMKKGESSEKAML